MDDTDAERRSERKAVTTSFMRRKLPDDLIKFHHSRPPERTDLKNKQTQIPQNITYRKNKCLKKTSQDPWDIICRRNKCCNVVVVWTTWKEQVPHAQALSNKWFTFTQAPADAERLAEPMPPIECDRIVAPHIASVGILATILGNIVTQDNLVFGDGLVADVSGVFVSAVVPSREVVTSGRIGVCDEGDSVGTPGPPWQVEEYHVLGAKSLPLLVNTSVSRDAKRWKTVVTSLARVTEIWVSARLHGESTNVWVLIVMCERSSRLFVFLSAQLERSSLGVLCRVAAWPWETHSWPPILYSQAPRDWLRRSTSGGCSHAISCLWIEISFFVAQSTRNLVPNAHPNVNK